jgi:hypothetical protein
MSKKIEAFWGNATADDVARVMKGETVEARFRDSETQPWGDCYTLTGWVNELRHQWRSAEAGGRWNFCQVYREPSWWLNKPEPGPGWRLLDKLPDEEPQLGDSVFCPDSEIWLELEAGFDPGQLPTHWYRRRIELEPKHYVLRVGDSVETPSGHRVQVISRSETQRFYALTAGDRITIPNGQTITITKKGFEVTQ